MKTNDLIPHLFRKEYSKIVAVLSKLFGIELLEMAEDIASETFLLAIESWPYKGIPENPTAWLYTVAKNKAINYFNRHKKFRDEISKELRLGIESRNELDIDLSERNISDSQLQLLFTICHPSISEESQICLALRTLCGFGIDEIADAFLTNKETINKRLHRAKEKFRSENIQVTTPLESELPTRLDTVLRTIYLLFSEGYYSESNPSLIRKELCLEAMNLGYLLLQNNSTNTHSTNSLMSLMCFQASRLNARLTEKGEIILYKDQDENLWSSELIEKGFYYLQLASKWEIASKYYLEASIAYWHTIKDDHMEKWESILKLYDRLIKIDTSPISEINRLYALSKVKGKSVALKEAKKLDLKDSPYFYLLESELFEETDQSKIIDSLKKAEQLSKSNTEKAFIQNKIKIINLD